MFSEYVFSHQYSQSEDLGKTSRVGLRCIIIQYKKYALQDYDPSGAGKSSIISTLQGSPENLKSYGELISGLIECITVLVY